MDHPSCRSTNRYGGRPIRNESAQAPSHHCPGSAEREARAESASGGSASGGSAGGEREREQQRAERGASLPLR
jgi:hypothetical protein